MLVNKWPKLADLPAHSVRWATEDVPERERSSWLREVIGREYTCVEITPPRVGYLFNEMTIHPLSHLRLSSIRSNSLGIERKTRAAVCEAQDAYFAVILLSGQYRLSQAGREVVLRPGEMTVYDAT